MAKQNHKTRRRIATLRSWAVIATVLATMAAGGWTAYGAWWNAHESKSHWTLGEVDSTERTPEISLAEVRAAVRGERWTEAQALLDDFEVRANTIPFQTMALYAEISGRLGESDHRQQILDDTCQKANRLDSASISTMSNAELSALNELLTQSVAEEVTRSQIVHRAPLVLTICERVIADSGDSIDCWALVAAGAVARAQKHGLGDVGNRKTSTTTAILAARADQLLWLAGLERGVRDSGGLQTTANQIAE